MMALDKPIPKSPFRRFSRPYQLKCAGVCTISTQSTETSHLTRIPVDHVSPARPVGNGWKSRVWDNMYGKKASQTSFQKSSPLRCSVIELLQEGETLRMVLKKVEGLIPVDQFDAPMLDENLVLTESEGTHSNNSSSLQHIHRIQKNVEGWICQKVKMPASKSKKEGKKSKPIEDNLFIRSFNRKGFFERKIPIREQPFIDESFRKDANRNRFTKLIKLPYSGILSN